MAAKTKDDVMAELTGLTVEFDKEAKYGDLCKLLKETLKAKAAAEKVAKKAAKKAGLTSEEKTDLIQLEKRANDGRNPPPGGDMLRLGKLRQKAAGKIQEPGNSDPEAKTTENGGNEATGDPDGQKAE